DRAPGLSERRDRGGVVEVADIQVWIEDRIPRDHASWGGVAWDRGDSIQRAERYKLVALLQLKGNRHVIADTSGEVLRLPGLVVFRTAIEPLPVPYQLGSLPLPPAHGASDIPVPQDQVISATFGRVAHFVRPDFQIIPTSKIPYPSQTRTSAPEAGLS